MNHQILLANTNKNLSPSNRQQHLSFLGKLHILLEEVETKTNQTNIVSWQPHGRCFRVHNTKEFVEKVMPHYFPQMTKWSSFYRQLNFYGFSRLTGQGPDKNGYYHKLFLRGKPHLCDYVIGTWKKGPKVRAKANANLEPNFYSMPQITTDDTTTTMNDDDIMMPPMTELKPQLTYDLSDWNLTIPNRDSSWGEFIGDIMGDSSDDLKHVIRRSFSDGYCGSNSKRIIERSRTV